MLQRAFLGAVCVASMLSCSSSPTVNPGSYEVTVQTYNLYVGFDILTILQAPTPQAVANAVTAGYEQVSSEFPKRKELIADEIARTHPDVVGLQEVATYYVQAPPVQNGLASNVTIDFLSEILAALDARGQHYAVGAKVKNTDAQIPGLVGGVLSDVRLTDHDVILVRQGMQVTNAQAQSYTTNLSVSLFGTSLELPRGWVSIEVDANGKQFRFVSTHLETEDAAPIQVAQATELLGPVLASSPLPTILVGDFNSRADDATTPTHKMVLQAGFTDAWAMARPNDPGFSCCQQADLTNPTSELDQRIDYVWLRGLPGATDAQLVGNEQDTRNAAGLWPSDHASVFATVTLP